MKVNVVAIMIAAVCVLAALLCSCAAEAEPSADPGGVQSAEPSAENPFNYEGPPDVLGSMGHGIDLPDGGESVVTYDGGELKLPYYVTGSGSGKNIGLLVYMNGVPQPYRIDGEGEYAYMHIFDLQNDDEKYRFDLSFVPAAGSAGETVRATIASIYYPQFKPDMVNSSGYGFYQGAASAGYDIIFKADPPEDGAYVSADVLLENVAVSNELMTEEFIERNLESGGLTSGGQSPLDRLDTEVLTFISYDGEKVYDNLDMTGRDTVRVAFELCGVPGTTLQVSFYANHAPLGDGTADCWEITLEKGKVARVEADVRVSELGDITTFYAAAVSGGGRSEFIKSSSLAFVRQSGSGADVSAPPAEASPSGTPLDLADVMDGSVRALWYGEGSEILIRKTDGLCLYDLASGMVIAEGSLPELTGAEYFPTEGGFCAVGEAASGGAASVALGEGARGETVCVFLDSTLAETDRFALTDPTGEGRHIMSYAVSPDGRHVAFSIMDGGIYLLARDGGEAALLRTVDAGHREENGGLTLVTNMWFGEDSSRVIFAGGSCFGSVGIDGSGFACASFEDFDAQGAVGYAGGKLFFNENFFVASGAMAIADMNDLSYTVFGHSAQEGRGDLYVSRDGEYFVTTAYDGGLTVRIYGAEDDSLRLEYTITDDDSAVFGGAPNVVLMDDLELCLVKLGGYADVPARVVTLSFE